MITDNGNAKAKIVIEKDAGRMVRYAAEEMREYIRKISGAELIIEEAPAGGKGEITRDENCIFIGKSAYTKKRGIIVSD